MITFATGALLENHRQRIRRAGRLAPHHEGIHVHAASLGGCTLHAQHSHPHVMIAGSYLRAGVHDPEWRVSWSGKI